MRFEPRRGWRVRQRARVAVQRPPELSPFGQPLDRNLLWQSQRLDEETGVVRILQNSERIVTASQEAGVSLRNDWEPFPDKRQPDVRRQTSAAAVKVGHHRADAGVVLGRLA